MLSGWEDHRRFTAGDYFPIFDQQNARPILRRLGEEGFRPFFYLSGLYYTFENKGREGSLIPAAEKFLPHYVIEQKTASRGSSRSMNRMPTALGNATPTSSALPIRPPVTSFVTWSIGHCPGSRHVGMDQTYAKPPYEEAIEALDRLEAKQYVAKGMIRDYVFELSEIAKRYIERRFEVQAAEFTTEELADWTKRSPLQLAERKTAEWFFSNHRSGEIRQGGPTTIRCTGCGQIPILCGEKQSRGRSAAHRFLEGSQALKESMVPPLLAWLPMLWVYIRRDTKSCLRFVFPICLY